MILIIKRNFFHKDIIIRNKIFINPLLIVYLLLIIVTIKLENLLLELSNVKLLFS